MLTRRQLANAIRALAMDAVEKANSGHPGMPMGMADIAEVLWRDFLSHNPNNPHWPNRDRFVISNGHGAMLQYALLHLTGYPLTLHELKQFRQWHSKTPGHPEFGETPGVETTTGPLGQGLANAVGMALAEKMLAAHFNREHYAIIDHHTYVFAGDGCLMEGISHEVCSLAGTLGLGKLIVFWDDNGISIDGDVTGWFTDNTPERFRAYGWQVVADVDGHDSEAITKAITLAKENNTQPSLICCRTQIGFGAPNLGGKAACHGSPLGKDEIALAREALQWPFAEFEIPEDYYAAWDHRAQGLLQEHAWRHQFEQYELQYPELAAEFLRREQQALPDEWLARSDEFIRLTVTHNKKQATRKASQQCLNAYAPLLPELVGGSADLTGSNCTQHPLSKIIRHDDFSGNYIEYGVREFGMAAMMNGMALHRGFIPYGGTFLVFSDYARNAIRLSALMRQRVIYVLTHDSIGLGEDGPTHQPIEHAASLRLIPGLHVWRPCDLTETAIAWQQALMYEGPSCLLLTRQDVPQLVNDEAHIEPIARGGYILKDVAEGQTIDSILIATGSEVAIAIEVANQLLNQNKHIRVVSMPCCEIFKSQPESYRQQVLPNHIKNRIAIEAGVPDFWYQFIGTEGQILGLNHFGASAPYEKLFAEYQLTAEHLANMINR